MVYDFKKKQDTQGPLLSPVCPLLCPTLLALSVTLFFSFLSGCEWREICPGFREIGSRLNVGGMLPVSYDCPF